MSPHSYKSPDHGSLSPANGSPSKGPGIKMGRMLIIDDDPSFGMLLQALAQSRGFETHYVASLLDLGSFARIKEFEVAVIDYYLGNLRGDEIAEYVDMFFQDVPVVIVSSNSFSTEDVEKWPSCVRRFVSKTEGAPKILERVMRVLDRDRLLKKYEQRRGGVFNAGNAALAETTPATESRLILQDDDPAVRFKAQYIP